MPGRLQLCLDDVDEGPEFDTAVSRTILERVDEGSLPATLRLSRPRSVVAFSRQDARSPGFAAAVAGAREEGFEAVLRLAGGRAAVFTPSTIAFAWAVPASDPRAGITERFQRMSGALADAFVSLGVDARVGEVHGEYCAGRWSVNAGGTRKVAGVGQRLLRGAAHTGGVVVVSDPTAIVRVLTPVYEALQLDWRAEATGALDETGSAIDWQAARDAVAEAFAHDHDIVPWKLDASTLERARTITSQHRVEG